MVRVARELHGGVVDIHVAEFDLRGVLREVFRYDLPPENRGFEDVGFVDRADIAASGFGGIDRDLGDALDFAGLIDHRVDCLLFAVLKGGGGFGLPEIDSAGEFPNADDVDSVGDALCLEGGGVGQFGIEETGAHVGVEFVGLPDREEGGALGLFLGREAFPFGAAHRPEEDRFAAVTDFAGGFRKSDPVVVDRNPADVGVLVFERKAEFFAGGLEDLQCHVHDFRADAVAG